MNRGEVLDTLGRLEEALVSQAASGELREQLVHLENRCEERPNLAWGYANQADTLVKLGRAEEACRLLHLAIPILREETQRPGRAQLRQVLASAEDTLRRAGG